jgi:hypothetical protein
MNETLKRSLSGAVYITLLLASILYSTESFFLLFGIFLVIAIYEFCALVQLNSIFPMLFGSILYTSITLISNYNKETTVFLNRVFLCKHTTVRYCFISHNPSCIRKMYSIFILRFSTKNKLVGEISLFIGLYYIAFCLYYKNIFRSQFL